MRRNPSSYPLTWHLMDILEAIFSKIWPKGGGLWNPYLMLSPAILLIGLLVLGLGYIGEVRLLEGSHTGTNYLLKEMVYIVGRKHRIRLRIIGFILAGILPGFVLLLFNLNIFLLILVFLIHLIGMSLIRWLFFAEAEHVVGLYY